MQCLLHFNCECSFSFFNKSSIKIILKQTALFLVQGAFSSPKPTCTNKIVLTLLIILIGIDSLCMMNRCGPKKWKLIISKICHGLFIQRAVGSIFSCPLNAKMGKSDQGLEQFNSATTCRCPSWLRFSVIQFQFNPKNHNHLFLGG